MKTYTASQLAAVLSRTRQAIYAALSDTPTTATRQISGQSVRAWHLSGLPEGIRNDLAAVAQHRNRPVEDLLADPPRSWTAPKPFADLPVNFQLEAEQWRNALALPLARRQELPEREWKELARQQCRRVFGREISDNTWLAHLDVVVNRDNGFEHWQRVALFVAESAYARSPALPRAALGLQGLHRELNETIATLDNKSRPTLDDRAYLLDAAFAHFEKLCQEHPERSDQKQIRRSLVHFLHSALPALARTGAALCSLFDRKLTAWRIGGRTVSAIADQRPLNSGQTAKKLCPECRERFKGAAVDLDGDRRQAWRRLHLQKLLCPECMGKWKFNVRENKSYLPASLDRDVSPDIQAALVNRRGPKFSRLCSPYVIRDHSNYGPGDFFEADDATLNHVFFAWDTDATGRPYVGRGECLLAIDRRTDYGLGYELILGDPDAAARYTSAHIRLLWLHVHDRLGLCHRGLWHENGVWAARLINGQSMHGWQFNPWRQIEHGLRDPRIGIGVRNTIAGNPRSKLIERVIGTLQQRTRCQAGFVGFNERLDKREVVSDFIARVKRGQEHPGNELLQVSEYRKLLDAELMAFADETQNGHRLPSVSPKEAWLNGIGKFPGLMDRPLRQLGVQARYLLATHNREVEVKAQGRCQGIYFKIGRQPFAFWGPELEPWQNRKIEVRLHLEEPDLLVCIPPGAEPFAMKARVLDANDATPEQLSETARARSSWMRRGKVIYDNLPHPLIRTISRDNDHDAATRELGAFVNAATERHRTEQQVHARKLGDVRRAATALGAAIPAAPRNVQRVKEGLDLEAEALAEIRALENQP